MLSLLYEERDGDTYNKKQLAPLICLPATSSSWSPLFVCSQTNKLDSLVVRPLQRLALLGNDQALLSDLVGGPGGAGRTKT